MSTKSSLAYGESFHLYHELMDDGDDVYLQLRGDNIEFDATQHAVTVRIPIHIWEHCRHYGGFTPRYHEMDDQALLQHVVHEVDERIKEWLDSDKSGLSAFFGSAVYGLASEPREQQIQQGFKHLVKVRTQEREIAARIRALDEEHAKTYDGSGLFVIETAAPSVKTTDDEP